MGESEVSEEYREREQSKQPVARRGGRITLATCVDSLREGWRKISGAAAQQPSRNHLQVPERRYGGHVSGVRRKRGLASDSHAESEAKRKTSFELFLSTLPKLDPIDRTVGWVFQLPSSSTTTLMSPSGSLTNLPPRGMLGPIPRPDSQGASVGEYDTSVSYCESARGTQGRGTPPHREAGQPRLDDLFRQLQLRQERAARRRLARKGERHLSSRNLDNITSSQLPGYPIGVTSELLPYLSHHPPATILHKNSSYYNKKSSQPSHLQPCCWGSCRVKCQTMKELLAHVVDEHISCLPARVTGFKGQGSQRLACEWRGCSDSSKSFGARYKLLIHVQTVHCTSRGKVSDVEPPATHLRTTHQPSATVHRAGGNKDRDREGGGMRRRYGQQL